ncbi:UDP-N-acetylmuramoyl-L-alanyl-D-glutamate--2,6-diaminopimelate ligase [Patescibacteria group bacterium]|nr:UDP-N-acetylmuramoyl-L-alanyl-D-glutamate--2,6-diaminopimelate ligase [Patescibacteria group bacterium]
MRLKSLIKKIIPDFLLSSYHYFLSWIGAFLYRFPSSKLTIIGVTGTSGKSTVVELTARIFEDAGLKTASMSSIKFKIGDKKWENELKMTMPGRMKIQRFLRQAVKADCKYAVLEVTSEGIKQYRHKFIDFDVAVFTNLSPEHIESHGSFEKYRAAKAKLFQQVKKIHIINIDDKNAEHFLRYSAEKKIKYGINDAGILPKDIKLLGKFNLYNAITATKIAMSQGISLETCKRALEKVKGIPGRMEIIVREPFTVVVDYAHTPEALEQVYKTLSDRRMICVLGSCGGGRDKWKRPVLGKIAAQYCDQVIITNEDPYDENPLKIMKDIESGFSQIPNPKSQIPKYMKILDRKEAIRQALKAANPGDVVIVTGKGSESWMCVAHGKKIPWDDRQIVLDFLNK